MRTRLAAILVLGSLVSARGPTFTASAQRTAPSTAVAGPGDRVHATRCIVKSIDENALVISRPRNRGDITFELRAETYGDGKIAVGSTVSVRYRDDGTHHVAIAIALQKG